MTAERVSEVLRAARAVIAQPDGWCPVGRGAGRVSPTQAIIDASVVAGIDYMIPLLRLGELVNAKSTGEMIEWTRHKTQIEALAAFDRALAALDPAEAA